MVVIDTSVWVEYFKRPDSLPAEEAARLVVSGNVLVVGPVIAELLQGARSQEDLRVMQEALTSLPFAEATRDTWVKVGRLSLDLRKGGIQIPIVDLYIAVLASERQATVYTLDRGMHRIPGVQFHQAEALGNGSPP